MEKESLLEFPCEFPIKVLGRESERFLELATSLVEPFVGQLQPHQISTRPSRNSNYIAITFTITATSQKQLDNIYHALSGHDEMLIVL